MAAFVMGVALIALGGYEWVRRREPAGAIRIPGTVVDVDEALLRISGRHNDRVYAPIIEFRHPSTGRAQRTEPQSHTKRRFRVGDSLEVVYDPDTERAVAAPDLSRAGAWVLFALGTTLIGLQVARWLS